MSNTWFRFRQFTLHQDLCAMKVTTDACIQGAWTPLPVAIERILDIGTGTGLLALMLAQRSRDTIIEAVEYDADAAQQATINAASSPWASRTHIMHQDIRTYNPGHQYDLIICNPPFFRNSLKNETEQKSIARHNVTLTAHELAHAVSNLLSPDGTFSLLLPAAEIQHWYPVLKKYGINEYARLEVKHTPAAAIKRMVSLLSFRQVPAPDTETLIIKDIEGSYTEQFATLLRPFYLNV